MNPINTSKNRAINKWQAKIDALRFENNRMKDRLANAMSKDVSISFLEEAEMFHQEFMDKDQIIDLIRHEMANMLLTEENTISLSRRQQSVNLKKDIRRLERELSKLGDLFSSHLTLFGL
jgi:polyhydroxyalkanoate synthesis regulator phasin